MWGDNSTYHSTRPPSATTPGLSLSRPDSASFQVQTCFLTSKYFLGMQSIKHKFKLWKMTILNSCRHEHTELRGWHPGTQIELSCIFKSTTYKTRRDSSQVDSSNITFQPWNSLKQNTSWIWKANILTYKSSKFYSCCIFPDNFFFCCLTPNQ